MEKVLEVKNLTKIFSDKEKQEFTAVSHIDFCLYEGECLGIIGESGSGKSTTVNMISRLIEPTEGSILLGGQDITKLKGRALRDIYKKMQMVFQSPIESFDPRCTLGDGIVESLRNQGLSKKDAREEGIKVGSLKIDTPWPFPEEEIAEIAKTASDIIVPEMNLGQIVHEVERAAHGEANVHLIGKIGGILHKPDEIYDKIKEING